MLPGYFKAMGIPLRTGRVFTEEDINQRSTAVIVNDAFVRLFLAGENPVGKRIQAAAPSAMEGYRGRRR